jgi:hypothetical protein
MRTHINENPETGTSLKASEAAYFAPHVVDEVRCFLSHVPYQELIGDDKETAR